jgi:sortase A
MLRSNESTQRRSAGMAARSAEWVLTGIGLAALLYCALTWMRAREAQAEAIHLGRMASPAVEMSASQVSTLEATARTASGVIGRIEIPALELSAPITDGIGNSELRHGVGHVPGTAVPGGLGTMGLAGHRDTYFRRLRGVHPGMQIVVSGLRGVYRYQVDSTEIVLPEQVDVLDVVDRPGLALVTCYPFEYIGAAPKRFIVHAHLLSAAADGE